MPPQAPRPPISGYLTLFKLSITTLFSAVRAAPASSSSASGRTTASSAGVQTVLLGAAGWLGKRAEGDVVGSQEFYIKLSLSILFVLIGGVFSGLTLGLMGLDSTNLRVLSTSGTPQQQRDASRVLSLLQRGRHWVLVSLLLGNVIVNETLPVFLDSITGGGGVAAIALASFSIVVFGEILPQAVCARYGLLIGAKCVPFVRMLMYIEAPVAYPVAKLLDWILGETHGTTYRKIELKTLVGLHGHLGNDSLSDEEVTMISAVLDLSDKSVASIMTPIEDCYTLSADAVLDQEKVDDILAQGHSRIPVHTADKESDFMGMMIVKKLISYDPSEAKAVASFPLIALPETGPTSTCLDALHYFQQGRSHMLLVSDSPGHEGGALGVVSLEDVVEELLGTEIVDETDVFVDVHNRVPVVRPPSRSGTSSPAGSLAMAPFIKGIIDRRNSTRSSRSFSSSPLRTSHSHHISSISQSSPSRPNASGYTTISSIDPDPISDLDDPPTFPPRPPPPNHRTGGAAKFVTRAPPNQAKGPKGFAFPSPVLEQEEKSPRVEVGERKQFTLMGDSSAEESSGGEGGGGKLIELKGKWG